MSDSGRWGGPRRPRISGTPGATRRQARRRTGVISALFGLALSGLAVRGAYLCVVPDPAVVDANDVQRWGRITLRAPRGEILDRDGRALATTVISPSVAVDPESVPEDERAGLAAVLGPLVGRDPASILAQLRQGGQYARVATHVHPATADAVRSLDHRAVWIERTRKRYYPEEALASQVVGFVDAAGRGRSGLEVAMDADLTGGTVVLQRRRDRRGVGMDREDFDPDASAGRTVRTTLDRTIQRAAERALERVVELHEPKAATAMVVDVHTGDILALANAPTFNPNAVGGNPAPRRNHAVQDWFEPGSVMKPFTLAAALEEDLVDEDTIVDCEGGAWFVGRSRIRDDHPKRRITATEVLKFSSNIGSAKLALELGPDLFLHHLAGFGFGQRTGVPLPGELGGVVRHPDRIRPIELATTAFGQGVTTTAIQLAMATAAIANGGELMEPRLVTEVVDSDGFPEWSKPPTRVRRVVSEETAAAVTRMMVEVTQDGGTGTRGRVPGYLVAAKTGTAQKAAVGGYGDGRVGSFVGFLPADDPAVAIVVMVDEPTKGSRYGGTVAGPAFAEIGAATMRHLGLPPSPDLLTPEEDHELVALADADPGPVSMLWTGDAWQVPDLTGRPVRDVLVGLSGAGVSLSIEGAGLAIGQDPAPGGVVRPGDAVAVVFQ